METKLFKLVSKRAALMRAPYAQSSWTINTSTIKKKKSTPQNKTLKSVPKKKKNNNNNNNNNNINLLSKNIDIDSKDRKENVDDETNKKI
ncbi:unnamed protein product [Rotaria sp. Silwood2]|nr:unnamed protein product [Rotaria sp. Silwood2]CAF4114025.1 unnamed protein product [Rotaria sp. Silwood2]